MPTYQHNNHSWQAGRAQHGSCSALRVIIMISADCWLLWCLRLSSIQCTLCVWALLIVLTLCPPFLSSSTLLMEERPKRRRGDKRQRPSDIMNTTQSGPSANRTWLEKKKSNSQKTECSDMDCFSPFTKGIEISMCFIYFSFEFNMFSEVYIWARQYTSTPYYTKDMTREGYF